SCQRRWPLSENGVRKRGCDAHSASESHTRPPHPQRDVPDIVDAQKDTHHRQRAGPECERGQRNERAQRKPAGPYELVPDAAKRAAQSRSESLDAGGIVAVELRTRQRADGHTGEIRMRVEVTCLARHRGVISLLGQALEQRFHAERNAVAEHCLVIPRPLYREQADERRDNGSLSNRRWRARIAPRPLVHLWRRHCSSNRAVPAPSPSTNSHPARAARCVSVQIAPAATVAASAVTTARE